MKDAPLQDGTGLAQSAFIADGSAEEFSYRKCLAKFFPGVVSTHLPNSALVTALIASTSAPPLAASPPRCRCYASPGTACEADALTPCFCN